MLILDCIFTFIVGASRDSMIQYCIPGACPSPESLVYLVLRPIRFSRSKVGGQASGSEAPCTLSCSQNFARDTLLRLPAIPEHSPTTHTWLRCLLAPSHHISPILFFFFQLLIPAARSRRSSARGFPALVSGHLVPRPFHHHPAVFLQPSGSCHRLCIGTPTGSR